MYENIKLERDSLSMDENMSDIYEEVLQKYIKDSDYMDFCFNLQNQSLQKSICDIEDEIKEICEDDDQTDSFPE